MGREGGAWAGAKARLRRDPIRTTRCRHKTRTNNDAVVTLHCYETRCCASFCNPTATLMHATTLVLGRSDRDDVVHCAHSALQNALKPHEPVGLGLMPFALDETGHSARGHSHRDRRQADVGVAYLLQVRNAETTATGRYMRPLP